MKKNIFSWFLFSLLISCACISSSMRADQPLDITDTSTIRDTVKNAVSGMVNLLDYHVESQHTSSLGSIAYKLNINPMKLSCATALGIKQFIEHHPWLSIGAVYAFYQYYKFWNNEVSKRHKICEMAFNPYSLNTQATKDKAMRLAETCRNIFGFKTSAVKAALAEYYSIEDVQPSDRVDLGRRLLGWWL